METSSKGPIAAVVAVVTLVILIGVGLVFVVKKPNVNSGSSAGQLSANTPARVVAKTELAANDGKFGHRCFVAVDGVVFEINQGGLWNNGKHESSDGQAYCGADLSEAIKQSPHGKSKLEGLTQIGRYQP